MYTVNKAFMQKLGYLLITHIAALWVILLRKKYMVIATCPESIARANCTPLWHAISNGWSEFLTNIAWSIGNGNSINLFNDIWVLFNDIWVPSLGSLRDHTSDPTLLSCGLSLKDFVVEDGVWDHNALLDLFPTLVIDHILSIKCPEQCDVDDKCMWRWMLKHNFELNWRTQIWLALCGHRRRHFGPPFGE
ncbi:hypothetical protein V6N11_001814 [Hibiscus sabdariffa]|uniref:Reverse transcriptase zinc-binding domain-containing protein n=1 Tax=Hibiscus sabdariffa TaxID=183260 RepID=A0ABR2QU59_9ROSI